MPTLTCLSAADLRQALLRFRDALRAHQEELNRLNVYPVPDGDTGTNMALTLESVSAELQTVGVDGRGVPRDEPGLADGRPRQLGRDHVADPARPRRGVPRPSTTVGARRSRAGLPPRGRRRVPGGDASGGGHDPHRRARDRRGGRGARRRPSLVGAARARRRRPRATRSRARPICSRCCARRAWSTRAARASRCCSPRCSKSVDGRPIPEPEVVDDARRRSPRISPATTTCRACATR